MKLFNLLILIIGLSSSGFSQSKQFKPKKGMTQIIPLYATMNVEVGQKLYYNAVVHGSVGIQANSWSNNDSIIEFKDTHFAYNNRRKAKLSGGDAGIKTFIFEALTAGKCIIVIEEKFRGELKKEYKIEITVSDKKDNKSKSSSIEKSKVKKDTIQLIPFKAKETICLGQKLIYTGSVHGSVGSGVKVWEENNGVLKLIDAQFKYDQVQVDGMTGGDAGIRSFIFEGKKIGKSTITIQETFRGEVKNEYKIEITVIENK